MGNFLAFLWNVSKFSSFSWKKGSNFHQHKLICMYMPRIWCCWWVNHQNILVDWLTECCSPYSLSTRKENIIPEILITHIFARLMMAPSYTAVITAAACDSHPRHAGEEWLPGVLLLHARWYISDERNTWFLLPWRCSSAAGWGWGWSQEDMNGRVGRKMMMVMVMMQKERYMFMNICIHFSLLIWYITVQYPYYAPDDKILFVWWYIFFHRQEASLEFYGIPCILVSDGEMVGRREGRNKDIENVM